MSTFHAGGLAFALLTAAMAQSGLPPAVAQRPVAPSLRETAERGSVADFALPAWSSPPERRIVAAVDLADPPARQRRAGPMTGLRSPRLLSSPVTPSSASRPRMAPSSSHQPKVRARRHSPRC